MIRSAVLAATLLAASEAGASCEPVIDLHVDLPYQLHYRRVAVDTRSLRSGCVSALVMSLHVPDDLRPRPRTFGEFIEVLETAERAAKKHALRVVYSVEGSQPLVGYEAHIAALIRRGVKIFGLVHARHNDLADASTDLRPMRGGLTAAGRRFVHRVYAAGGIIDVSHASSAALFATAATARHYKRPVIATHSNARAIADHKRNLSDLELRAIAATGGLVGVAFHAPFLRSDGEQAGADDVAKHVAHMIAVMGDRHVAIGSDLDGLIVPASGLSSHAGMPLLAVALRRAGITGRVLRQVLSGNARRVLGL